MSRSTQPSRQRKERTLSVRRPGALAVDLVLLVVVLLLVSQTLELGSAARRFPLIMLIVMAALVVVDALVEAFPAVRRRTSFLEADFVDVGSGLDVPEQEPDLDGPQVAKNQFRVLSIPQALGWLVALAAGMYFFGYVIMTPLFLGLFFLWARVPAKVAVGIVVVMTSMTYFVFNQYLGLR